MERDSSKTFANPFIACTTCGIRVVWYNTESGNDPCGHHNFNSVCPSWSPIDGCLCLEHLGSISHGTPEGVIMKKNDIDWDIDANLPTYTRDFLKMIKEGTFEYDICTYGTVTH